MIGVFGGAIMSSFGSDGGERVGELMAALSTISAFDILLMFSMLVPVAAIFASLLLLTQIINPVVYEQFSFSDYGYS